MGRIVWAQQGHKPQGYEPQGCKPFGYEPQGWGAKPRFLSKLEFLTYESVGCGGLGCEASDYEARVQRTAPSWNS